MQEYLQIFKNFKHNILNINYLPHVVDRFSFPQQNYTSGTLYTMQLCLQ